MGTIKTMLAVNKIIQGDCLIELKQLPENSVDSIITDPPYGIGFMGKEWDNFKPKEIKKTTKLVYKTDYVNGVPIKRKKPELVTRDSRARVSGTYDLSYKGMLGFQNWYCEVMKECLRVLKPGGHLLSFGGTRTYHRMAVAVEDAGFEVRDMIEWVYGSGFPKSLNIAKKLEGITGKQAKGFNTAGGKENFEKQDKSFRSDYGYVWKPTNENAKQYEGWGTALKPAHEPICMARKPLSEKTVAENVLKWRTGGLNIDATRIPTEDGKPHYGQLYRKANQIYGGGKGTNTGACLPANLQGRFPANLIHDNSPEVRECFPRAKGGAFPPKRGSSAFFGLGDAENRNKFVGQIGDDGSAFRFFKSIIYTAKASKNERNMGCEGLEEKEWGQDSLSAGIDRRNTSNENPAKLTKYKPRNNHPTVKPIALMEYLIKMITPKGGIVLDPFCGSGSTLIAAKKNKFNYIGIEKEKEYCDIAEARIRVIPQPLF